jgi:hypothetical protein
MIKKVTITKGGTETVTINLGLVDSLFQVGKLVSLSCIPVNFEQSDAIATMSTAGAQISVTTATDCLLSVSLAGNTISADSLVCISQLIEPFLAGVLVLPADELQLTVGFNTTVDAAILDIYINYEVVKLAELEYTRLVAQS